MADFREAVIGADRAWEDAIIGEDAKALESLAAKDLIYTHAGGTVDGRDAFIAHIVNGPRQFTKVDYDDLEVRINGDAAVLTAALHLETVDRQGKAGSLHFRVTHVWFRSAARWRLVANQSTHLPSVAGERQ